MCNPPVYTCNPPDYMCNPVDYTCKVLNFRFTAPILITVLDTVEVTPFFSKIVPLVLKLPVNWQFTVKQWFRTCKVVIYIKSSSLQLVKWWFIVKQQFTPVNNCFTKKNLKERCYLHSVQQSYEKNSCKPKMKQP